MVFLERWTSPSMITKPFARSSAVHLCVSLKERTTSLASGKVVGHLSRPSKGISRHGQRAVCRVNDFRPLIRVRYLAHGLSILQSLRISTISWSGDEQLFTIASVRCVRWTFDDAR